MAKQPGLDDRHRDTNGQTREKNGNTRIDTLRDTYGDDFAAGIRGDAHLRTLLDRTGSSSLSELAGKFYRNLYDHNYFAAVAPARNTGYTAGPLR